MESTEPQYIFEEFPNADGTSRKVMKTPDGVMTSESIYDRNHQLIERKDYDAAGNITGRAIYEQDGQRKPLKTTSYDHKGNLIYVQERGKPPIFYGEHQAGAPQFMRADNQKKS